MEEDQRLSTLEEIWSEPRSEGVRCCECEEIFGDEAIIRTFRVARPSSALSDPRYAKKIRTASLHIILADRHEGCQDRLRYVAVSHVWDRTVAAAHLEGPTTSLKVKARDHILDALEQICTGLADHIDEEMEIWYDYISVPQWEKPLKERIISAITRVFYNAHFTLVHLSDIDDNTIKLLRHGGTQEDRIRGVTGICNAKWFSRVWTVMELIRSQNPRVMNSHYRIVERVRDVFLDEVNDVWNSELVASGNVHELESLAQMGKNIVPWNLGPLRISHIAKVVDFGTAFTLLSRRGCASDSDFFEALLGIVRPRRVEGKLSSDPAQAMRQIAVSCLEMGDYSPLLMMSRSYNGGDNHTFYSTSAHRNGAAHLLERCGYLDVMTYALGPLEGFPTHHAESEFRPGLRLKLEIIGKVTFAMTDTTRLFQPWLFLIIARTVLNFTGPNVDQFVRTIGSRLYNLCNEDVEEVLSDKDAWARIHEILYQWYNKTGTSHNDEERFPSGQTLAGLIGLDRIRTRSHRLVSAMDWMGEHGGTLHGANAGNLIAARCLGCHETFVYRAAFLRPPSEVYGSMAYRLAGVLHQGRSNESLGILVKDTEIVGRLVWASRACECRLTEKVDISLHDLPKRRPRN